MIGIRFFEENLGIAFPLKRFKFNFSKIDNDVIPLKIDFQKKYIEFVFIFQNSDL